MNKLNVIFNELDDQTALKFVSACMAKHRGLIGVPRICIHKNTRISTKMLKEMFKKSNVFDKENTGSSLLNESNIKDI